MFIYIFNADVWGHVSDWVMVIFAATSAIFLYKTLRSQQDVQKTQNELYKIESIRFRESIKPILKYSGSIDKMKPGDESKKILTIEVINETSSIALDISKIVANNKHSNQIFIPIGFADRRNHLVKDDAPLLFHFLLDSEYVTFILTYQDVAGSKYKQSVICICDEYGIEIHPSLSEII